MLRSLLSSVIILLHLGSFSQTFGNFDVSFDGFLSSDTNKAYANNTITETDVFGVLPEKAESLRLQYWEERQLLIEPNPMLGLTYLQFYVPYEGSVAVIVSTTNGTLMSSSTEFLSKGVHTFELASVSKGMFFVLVYGNGFIYNKKLLSNNTELNKPKFTLTNLSISE